MKFPERDKIEFTYRYRLEFTKLAAVKTLVWFPMLNYSPMKKTVKQLASRARVELGYSQRTIDVDIIYHLQKKFQKVIK